MLDRSLFCLAVLSLLIPLSLAEEGRIPIFEPTTIDSPGTYVLTRSFEASGAILTIESSARAVRIDLNGLFIIRSDSAGPVVDIVADGSGDRADVDLRNGIVAGGSSGIRGGGDVTITNVGFFDQAGDAVDMSDSSFGRLTVSGCTVANAGGRGIFAQRGEVRIVGNLVEDSGSTGIEVIGGGGFVADNIVNFAVKNGISVTGNSNRIEGNVVTDTQESAPDVDGDGIYVEGARNVIQDNVVNDNQGFGLVFDSNSENVYRDNVLRGNQNGAALDPGTQDEGGNVT